MNDISNLLKIGFPHSKISMRRIIPILIKYLNQTLKTPIQNFKNLNKCGLVYIYKTFKEI